MPRYYVTYFDRNYLTRAVALIESLNRHAAGEFQLFAICMDEVSRLVLERLQLPGVVPVPAHALEGRDTALLATKRDRSLVEYYWTFTPTAILRLLEAHGEIDVLTYLDADLYFYASPEAIFQEFGANSILIHEHRFPARLAHNLQNGRYNVGLVSFRNDAAGLEALTWWRARCLEWCFQRLEAGKFGDQAYLDDWPTRFPNVHVLQQVGAAVAPWNHEQYAFDLDSTGNVRVAGEPLIFYHFHSLTYVNPGLVVPVRGVDYPLTEPILRLCFLPYLRALSRAAEAVRAVIPDFEFGLVTPKTLTVEHTFFADQGLRQRLTTAQLPQRRQAFDEVWDLYCSERQYRAAPGEAPPAPRAAETLRRLLESDDILAALQQHTDLLDAALLAHVRAAAQQADQDGDQALAGAMTNLATYLEQHLAPAAASDLHQAAAQLVAEGRWAEAQAVLGQALERAPADAGLLVLQGNVALQLGEIAAAEAAFSAAAQAAPEAALPRTLLGMVLVYQKRFREAEPVLRQALERDPADANAQTLLAGVREALAAGAATAASATPVISAIVSTYKSEALLRACLEDLEAQTIADELEIIVVDSASPQNERAVVREFQARYPNIRYVRTAERESLYAAWNRGLLLARGRYVTNANTDDAHRPDALEKLVAALDAHPAADLAYAHCAWTGVPNAVYGQTPVDRIVEYPPYHPALSLHYCLLGPHPVWRRTVFDKIGLFDPTFRSAGDYEFQLRFTAAGLQAVLVPEVLSLFYQNPNGLTFQDSTSQNEQQMLYQRYRGLLPIQRLYALPSDDAAGRALAWVAHGNLALALHVPWVDETLVDIAYALNCFQAARQQDPACQPAWQNLIALLGRQARWAECEQLLQFMPPDLAATLQPAVAQRQHIKPVLVTVPPAVAPLVYQPGAVAAPEVTAVPVAAPTRPAPDGAPRPGFNIIGHVSGNLGLGVLARNVASTLLGRGYPIAVLDLDPGMERGGHDRRFDPFAVASVEALPHDINLFVLPSPAMPWVLRATRAALRPGRLNVALIMWELTVIPPAWRAALECFDVIVAESEFIRHVTDFSLSNVFTVSAAPPLDLPAAIRPDRARWGLPADAVVYVASFEPYSDVKRKNIKAVIDAFRQALSRETRAHLVIKANNVQADPELRTQVQKLVRQMSGGHPRVHLVAENLSYRDVLGLYASADVYVSLHRAEGLGLGLMEAMALGKPVIATAWSGNLTFMDHTNACLVGQRLIPVDGTIPAYQKENLGADAVWADPDVDEAAAWMTRLFREPALRAVIGQRAAAAMTALQQRAAQASFVDELQAIWEHRRAVPALAARKAEALERYLGTSRAKVAPVQLVARAQSVTPAQSTAPVPSVAPARTSRVDIVVPVYGQAELLRRCVDSVLRTAPDAHLILVDDCSPGTEIRALFAEWRGRPQLTLARTPENQGFVGACRLGAALGQAPFVLFLNSDTEALTPGWLEALLPTEDDVAIVGAKLLYPVDLPGPLAGTLQHAGVARDDAGVPYHPFLGWPADTPAANTPRDVNAVTGACLLVRRTVWNELGGWDARFGKGVYEDVDLCWQARARGYRVLYQPAAVLVHHESASKSPDGRHNLNAHTQANRQSLLAKWPSLASDEALFFGEAYVRARQQARRQLARATTALKQRNLKAAESALRKALTSAPDLPEALVALAQLHEARGAHAQAADLYARVLATAPTAWEVRTHLVDAWLAAGQPERAALEWRQLHAVFPTAPEVTSRQAQVAAYLPVETAAPAASDRAAETLSLVLAADDILEALDRYADRLDAAVLDLVQANAQAARQDGDTALAEGLTALVEQVAARLPAASAPIPERAVHTLRMLLAHPDLPAALFEHEHLLDADLLALVRLNADTARADGKVELGDGLDLLAAHIQSIVERSGPAASAEAQARAEETLELLIYAPDLAAALEQYAERLDQALVDVLQRRAEAARQDGELETAAALSALAEHIAQWLAAAPDSAADPGATLALLLGADDVLAALERYADRLTPELLALIRANGRAAQAEGELELAEGLELLAGVVAQHLEEAAQPVLA